MARRVARYAFLNARVSVLAEQLLGEQELISFLHTPIPEQRALLERMGLGSLDVEEAARTGTLARGINELILQDMVKLIRPLQGGARALLSYWARRFELVNLKAIIRARLSGQDAETIKRELLDLGEFDTLSTDELLGAEDIAEMLRQLERKRHYSPIARQARRVFEEHHDAFILDASIDRGYFAGLYQHLTGFTGEDAANLRIVVGDLIDRINLVWLLRYRFAYELPPVEAYYLLIPAGVQLGRHRLMSLVELESWDQIKSELPEPMRGWVAETRTVSDVHYALKREGVERARRILYGSAFNLGRAFAYLQLREGDLRRVGAILRGRVLKVDPTAIVDAAELGPGALDTESAA
jgi:V/A-type H+-transporting ATPase subunit C